MRIGLDIGSTTIKAAVLDDEGQLVFKQYKRHFSRITARAIALLEDIEARFPAIGNVKLAISGSAGMGLAGAGGIPFVQEVYATGLSAERYSPDADVMIELGGEDAKILFLKGVSEARMNGSCAGGTGAFIDQMATLLKITPAQLNEKAKQHEKIHSIASRCGVFAKSDIQPLLNQGARMEDVSASILYAVVNQTIAGLAQGRAIGGRVLYLGGPLTFMSELRRAFDDVLKTEGILPDDSLYYVALGAALYANEGIHIAYVKEKLRLYESTAVFDHTQPLFKDQSDYEAFLRRHERASVPVKSLEGFAGFAHLGIDAGSTTVKTALISDEGELIHTSYRPNSGNPVPLIKEAMLELYAACPGLTLKSVTTTGYGEELTRAAFNADFGIVETVAHYTAARHFQPNVDFIIDIGGQDMKCFKIENGYISDIFLNEACSSGCGSFLQTFAEALGESAASFAKLGLFANAPVELGSRCTVFMNSSVKQAQKDGASLSNISAGLAISVVKNALYKVIRPTNPEELGRYVVVQGGTFYNDAVLRAFEMELGMEVIRPSIAGLMGAFGAALYGRERAGAKSGALDANALKLHEHSVTSARCKGCTNNCSMTVNIFSGDRKYISGNRCDRPVKKHPMGDALNLYEYKRQLLSAYKPQKGRRGKIGIPMGLNFYENLPFYHTLLTQLGFEVVTGPPSTRELYFLGQSTIPSDTVCYPAKLMHGHIKALSDMEGVNAIFYPCMSYSLDEGLGNNHYNCPVVAYYPEVIKANCLELEGKNFIYDYMDIDRRRDFPRKLFNILKKSCADITPDTVYFAAKAAYKEYEAHLRRVRIRGLEIIDRAREEGRQIIVLSGRPYHVDSDVNHGIDKLITSFGAAVISEDSIAHINGRPNVNVLNQWSFHARMYAAAEYILEEDDMNLVQLVSFGCGLDAVTADEVRDILHRRGKLYTQIKIDEIANLGAVNIRLKSLFAALDMVMDPKRREAV